MLHVLWDLQIGFPLNYYKLLYLSYIKIFKKQLKINHDKHLTATVILKIRTKNMMS